MTTRRNALDQLLDISGSLNHDSSLDVSEELSRFGAPVSGQTGSSASINVGGTVVVSGLTGISSISQGNFITISGAATAANNGTFLITTVLSATSVEIDNTSAATDANNGSISWVERQPYSLEDDINYVRSDRAAIKGVEYYEAIPTYFRCVDQLTEVPANLSNIAGNTIDAKAFVINKKYEDRTVSAGDGYILLSAPTELPYADSVNITGVPIDDGFDAGNDKASYVHVVADGYGGVTVLSGQYSGYRVFGRTRAGTSGVDGYSVEIEFRAVRRGDPISNSVAYTWELTQPEVIDLYIGYRECLGDIDENAFREILVNSAGTGEGSDSGSSQLPGADQIGQVLYSTDGIFFRAELPVTGPEGWLVNNDGILIVTDNGDGGTTLPGATQIGQVLYSVDGIIFTARLPVTGPNGWLVNGDGILLVI